MSITRVIHGWSLKTPRNFHISLFCSLLNFDGSLLNFIIITSLKMKSGSATITIRQQRNCLNLMLVLLLLSTMGSIPRNIRSVYTSVDRVGSYKQQAMAVASSIGSMKLYMTILEWSNHVYVILSCKLTGFWFLDEKIWVLELSIDYVLFRGGCLDKLGISVRFRTGSTPKFAISTVCLELSKSNGSKRLPIPLA